MSRSTLGIRSFVTPIALALVFLDVAGLCAQAVNFDIVYVRWPRRGGEVVTLPQSEVAYWSEPGADLVLRHPDGRERILVDCDTCCVQDPSISFDGEWVYYTKMEEAHVATSPSLLYKMRIAGPNANFREVQLTFNDGSVGYRHAGNTDRMGEMSAWLSLRDMGPQPLPGGKIAFTSNRQAEVAFRGTPNIFSRHVMQMWVMDDHDGSLTSADLSNMRQVGFGNLGLVLHPVILQDGRLMFTNWDAAAGKYLYGMSTLYTMNPDGTNLAALTEPHDFLKNADHFHTQLGNGTVVTTQYYPSYNFGFGTLVRFPIEVEGPAYSVAPVMDTEVVGQDMSRSRRNYDRIGWETVTPHTFGEDCPAPNLSGKYCFPSAAPGGNMLASYSPGGVNYNHSCSGGVSHVLRSGIYLIRDASEQRVYDPNNRTQLVPIVNTTAHNEIWPRAVVPYSEIHGMDQPVEIPFTDSVITADDRLEPADPHAIVGTSSLYNRESAPIRGDPFYMSGGRHTAAGNWMLQGADAGIFDDKEIHAVRIVGVVPTPFRRPRRPTGVEHLLPDSRSDPMVRGFGSAHGERWKILAEIPVRKSNGEGGEVLDPKGDPDTSFAAKIPADLPFFFQGLDKEGMTLFSELTWRHGAAGEVRTDCGGCHAHSLPPVDFAGTAAGRREAISTPGVSAADPMIAQGLWRVSDKTPLIAADARGNPTVQVVDQPMVGVEFHRDVMPILQRRCVSCHKTAGNTTGTDLAFDGSSITDNAYFRLAKDYSGRFGGGPPGGQFLFPQLSKYVRANQARQSLLVWKLFGRRLDGRENSTRSGDLDFTPHSVPHGATKAEMRTIARWIDLGCPIDFTPAEHNGWRYTDDNSLPTLEVGTPRRGRNASFDGIVRVGVTDPESGVDWSTLKVQIDTDLSDGVQLAGASIDSTQRPASSSVAWLRLSDEIADNREVLLVATVYDRVGNMNRQAVRFWVSNDPNSDPEGIPERPDELPGEPPPVVTEDPVEDEDPVVVVDNYPPPSEDPGGNDGGGNDGGSAPSTPPEPPVSEDPVDDEPPVVVEETPPTTSEDPIEDVLTGNDDGPVVVDTSDPPTSEDPDTSMSANTSPSGGGASDGDGSRFSTFGCRATHGTHPASLWYLVVPFVVCLIGRRRARHREQQSR